jgi:hypothetical protein
VETTSLTVSYISTNIGIIVEYMAESLNFYWFVNYLVKIN